MVFGMKAFINYIKVINIENYNKDFVGVRLYKKRYKAIEI